jgi:peptide/nickel transport system substrate-binding protein
MRVRRTTALTLIPIAAVLAVTGCQGASTPDEELSVRIGVSSGLLASQFDPFAVAFYQSDVSGVYETLATGKLNPDDPSINGLQPLLAKTFELSDDRKTLTVELHSGVRYADGTPMTAESVVEYFEALATDPDSPYLVPLGGDFNARFEPLDDTTFEVTTDRPIDAPGGPYGTILLSSVMVNPDSLSDREALATTPNGTGPYLVDEVVPQVKTVLVRNPDYWGGDDRYPFDEITFMAFDDDVALLNALKSGQIDAAPVGLASAPEAEAAGFSLFENSGRFTALWIADRGGDIVPALGDARVRQAIAYAFDREAINESINHGHGRVTSQGASRDNRFGYIEGGDDRYGYDLEKARNLMREAGYEDGFELTIPTTAFLGIDAWVPIVEQTLSELNIRVTWEPAANADAYFQVALSGQYPALLYSEQPTGLFGIFLSPGAVFDVPAYEDPQTAKYWDTIVNGSRDDVAAAYAAIAEYALDEAWLIVFASANNIWAADAGISVSVQSDGFAMVRYFGVTD